MMKSRTEMAKILRTTLNISKALKRIASGLELEVVQSAMD
jgi:hypothetical protein